MRAFVYQVMTENDGEWRVSLQLQADRDYWVRVHGASFKLRVLEPSLSFGQACRLMQQIREKPELAKDSNRLQQAAISMDLIPATQGERWKWWTWLPSDQDVRMAQRTQADMEKEAAWLADKLQGRYLLKEDVESLLQDCDITLPPGKMEYLLQLAWLRGTIDLEPGIQPCEDQGWLNLRLSRAAARMYCKRCGATGIHPSGKKEPERPTAGSGLAWSMCPHCGTDCAYCEACLTMGRVRSCTPLIQGLTNVEPAPALALKGGHPIQAYTQSWGLSDVQAEASEAALHFLEDNQSRKGPLHHVGRFLIWAVTGAGKTEMIFPMLQYTADRGGKIAVVTPRRDVVLELKPRLEKAFPNVKIVTLYGGSKERWESGGITLATTHQMLRFREAFDLVIVDEIDAFPYHNNPMLLYAVDRACKPKGAFILLSATPPEPIRRAANRGRLAHVRVPARFHRHPLPVPKLLRTPKLGQQLREKKLSGPLMEAIAKSLERGAQVFVFVPNISSVEPVVGMLRAAFKQIGIDGTSSKDALRAEKVVAFRGGSLRLLVTTTILERGVTIPKSDVFILDVGSSMFDAAALIQMAGRAGRSAQDPNGLVYFASEEKTRSQALAIAQIKQMNRIARRKGYIR